MNLISPQCKLCGLQEPINSVTQIDSKKVIAHSTSQKIRRLLWDR